MDRDVKPLFSVTVIEWDFYARCAVCNAVDHVPNGVICKEDIRPVYTTYSNTNRHCLHFVFPRQHQCFLKWSRQQIFPVCYTVGIIPSLLEQAPESIPRRKRIRPATVPIISHIIQIQYWLQNPTTVLILLYTWVWFVFGSHRRWKWRKAEQTRLTANTRNNCLEPQNLSCLKIPRFSTCQLV